LIVRGRTAITKWSALSFGVLLSLGACSVLAPPDSELVGTRPTGGSDAGGSAGTAAGTEAGGTSTGGADVGGDAGAGIAGEPPSEGGNSPGKPVDVGTPTGEWTAGPGLKTRFAAEVAATDAHRDYPRPRLTRHAWATLNGLWDVAVSTSGNTLPKFDGTQILVPFPLESQLSGVEGGSLSDKQFLWYRRVFQLPEAWRGQRVLMHFGAVDWDSSVRVNGVEVVTHRGGYDGFSADISEQLAAGSEQEVVVRVFDPTDAGTQPRGKQALVPDTGTSFSAVSGIWQSVWLEPVPEVSIQDVELRAELATGMVSVTPALNGAPVGTTLRVIVFDEGSEVSRSEVADGESATVLVPAPKPWSPDSPFLYDVTLELWRGEELLDSADSYFAFRSISLGKDGPATKLMLNDEPLLSMGVLSQGYWPEGLYTPPTDAALKSDLSLVRNLGFNSVRVHEKLESERFYYWADRLGVLVWQDVPAGVSTTDAARDEFSAELSAMVSERRAHPSLAVWTLFTGGRGVPGADVAERVDQVKRLTTDQLLIGASGTDDEGSGDLRDRPDRFAVTSPAPDERGVVLGEYGSLSRSITGHTWSGTTGAAQTAADTTRYVDLARRARGLARRPGLSAALFRQLTDVENELDGLVTYDRAVTKITANTIASANTGETEPIVPIVQASEFEVAARYLKDAQGFRYVTVNPGGDQWNKPGFNDSAWTKAAAGIGGTADAGARVRTLLNFDEIWTRTTFTLDEKPTTGRLLVRMMYDEDTQVYVNGVRASDTYHWVTSYGDFLASDAALGALVVGDNTIATHTMNGDGGRYIDVGLLLTTDPPSYRPADAPAATTAGLTYADYDLALDSLPADISMAGPAARATGTSTLIGSYAPALAADNARALRLHGYVEVVQNGVYTFFVDTDDGARLSIGASALAESSRSDGTGVTRRAGNIALAKGKHEITIDYFANDNVGANNFVVSWAGPGFNMSTIAAGNLSH
jgi:hypothetical protein